MNKEERDKYNKEYYSKKKEDILKKLSNKEPCEICGKMVRHQYKSLRHKQSKACMKAGNLKKMESDKIQIDKETYETIMKFINENKLSKVRSD